MALRKGHGQQKGTTRIEVMPPDEQPEPVPAKPEQLARRADGTIANSEAAKALGARGGLARATKKRLLQGLGLSKLADQPEFKPYYDAAQAWLDAEIVAKAAMCGGYLGPGPIAMLGNAALMLAASRYLFDIGFGNPQLMREGAMQADRMKQQELAAYELGIREARARAELSENGTLDAFEAALSRQKAAEEPEDEPGE